MLIYSEIGFLAKTSAEITIGIQRHPMDSCQYRQRLVAYVGRAICVHWNLANGPRNPADGTACGAGFSVLYGTDMRAHLRVLFVVVSLVVESRSSRKERPAACWVCEERVLASCMLVRDRREEGRRTEGKSKAKWGIGGWKSGACVIRDSEGDGWRERQKSWTIRTRDHEGKDGGWWRNDSEDGKSAGWTEGDVKRANENERGQGASVKDTQSAMEGNANEKSSVRQVQVHRKDESKDERKNSHQDPYTPPKRPRTPPTSRRGVLESSIAHRKRRRVAVRMKERAPAMRDASKDGCRCPSAPWRLCLDAEAGVLLTYSASGVGRALAWNTTSRPWAVAWATTKDVFCEGGRGSRIDGKAVHMLRPLRLRAHLHDFRGASGGRSGAEVDVDVRAMELGERRTAAARRTARAACTENNGCLGYETRSSDGVMHMVAYDKSGRLLNWMKVEVACPLGVRAPNGEWARSCLLERLKEMDRDGGGDEVDAID
ncbi:hypothetical protein B0H13DRAFT_2512072 [Mycena leptocephala]|nr:hypothetical protein B0H13DRAFT_2512072 [Mycena leptocephala]